MYYFGILCFAALISYEKRVEMRGGDPILAYSLLRNHMFQRTLIIGLLSGGSWRQSFLSRHMSNSIWVSLPQKQAIG